MKPWRLGYRPGLDGLRGVAVLLVVINHAVPSARYAGQVGVSAFFVLSGFLITSLLLAEHDRTGTIRIAAFYLRRARRLAPALIVCITLVWAFATAAGLSMGAGGGPAALLYTMDFVQATRDQFDPGLFGHTWSLAIEEHFYVVWPLALTLLLRKRRAVAPALGCATVAASAWMIWLAAAGVPAPRITYGPDTRSVALMAGCFLAAWFITWGPPRISTTAATLALISFGPLSVAQNLGLADTAQFLLVIPSTLVILTACATNSTPATLRIRWLRAIGDRSYGIYLWHFPLAQIVLAADVSRSWQVRGVVALALTAGIVELSWRYVERPFLRQASGAVTVPAVSDTVPPDTHDTDEKFIDAALVPTSPPNTAAASESATRK